MKSNKNIRQHPTKGLYFLLTIDENMHIKVEYVWLDGTKPNAQMRSKTKIMIIPEIPSGDIPTFGLTDVPEWSFDGSSTNQAPGDKSDCLLKPIRLVADRGRSSPGNACIVLCEVLNADGSNHETNHRASFDDDNELWFGFEQEYTFTKPGTGRPLGFPEMGFPAPQGPYYCAVGYENVVGREIAEEHLDLCLNAGLNMTGINAEVMLGQWEYQVFGKGAKLASDDCWLARYLLFRVAERHSLTVSFHPKPVTGDWNGSGMHTNFSTKEMREVGGEKLMTDICKKFAEAHMEHITAYGHDNDKRLSGLHETQHINKFSFGISDRGASIRIPLAVAKDNWKGYLEDRRPASNADPYKIAERILKTLRS